MPDVGDSERSPLVDALLEMIASQQKQIEELNPGLASDCDNNYVPDDCQLDGDRDIDACIPLFSIDRGLPELPVRLALSRRFK